jgi:hypothetical protein
MSPAKETVVETLQGSGGMSTSYVHPAHPIKETKATGQNTLWVVRSIYVVYSINTGKETRTRHTSKNKGGAKKVLCEATVLLSTRRK